MSCFSKAVPGAILLLALALGGCGGSGSNSSSTSAFGTIPFQSPAISSATIPATMPARYTCDGKDVSPPLEWGAVPSGTKELAIYLINLTASSAAAGTPFTAEWAIAGVNPSLHKIAAGEVPPGAHVGTNGNGGTHYSLCPKKGESRTYQFAIYSLRPSVTPGAGFLDASLLREIASGPSPTSATAGGAIRVTYTRK
jgi:phosphatidylethanolamine-binding protein (PEBP) family uncharacterized protein